MNNRKAIIQGERILDLSPQRPPIVMVDSFFGIEENHSYSGLTVTADNIFCETGKLQEAGIIEHIAQSVSYTHLDVYKRQVQPYYSLRCVPQILGPIYDELENAEEVLINEINSACDNPIVDPDTQNIYHGGNFHGDYISFEMDKLKIAVTKLTMLCERQINYLFHDRINGILPPFVNLGVLGLNYGLQASQFTATSTTAAVSYTHLSPTSKFVPQRLLLACELAITE